MLALILPFYEGFIFYYRYSEKLIKTILKCSSYVHM